MTPGTMEATKAVAQKKVKAIIDSSSETRIGWAKVAILIIVAVAAISAGKHVWYRQAGDPIFGFPTARGQASTVLPAVVEDPTPEATATDPPPTPTQNVETVFREVEVIVTATPTPTPNIVTEYRDVYIEVPVETIKIVTETVYIELPTPTPIGLAPGTIEICLRVEGAREIYIGDAGLVSGACQTLHFGVGQTSIPVKVNR